MRDSMALDGEYFISLYRPNVLNVVFLQAHILYFMCSVYLGSYIRHSLCIISSRPVANLKMCCCVFEKIDALIELETPLAFCS
jgi:hypothetical protein